METRKRLYVGLMLTSLTALALLLLGLGYLFKNRDIFVSQVLLTALLLLFSLVLLFLGLGILALVIMIMRSKTSPTMENIAGIVNSWLFPWAVMIGRIAGLSRESILRSFISVNNYLVRSKEPHLTADKIMVLAPHCLQNSDCPHKITLDIDNCQECGNCKIGELKELCAREHVMLKIASGGTLARKFVKDNSPGGIIAIACERDLALGIQDIGVLPILGVLNCRPNGPCVDTDVEMPLVLQAMDTLTGK